MIYLDHEGKLKTCESQSIQEQNASVFTPEVCQNFLDILGERIGYHQPAHRNQSRILITEPLLILCYRGNGFIFSSVEAMQEESICQVCFRKAFG
jgi:hypothetical protein